MELRHLRYFVAVAEESHFGRAAARLRVSAPSLSQQIRALERTVRAPLFSRHARGAELTAAGVVLLPRARAVLAAAAEAVAATRAAGGEIFGTLDVVCETDAERLVAPALEEFSAAHRHVRMVAGLLPEGRVDQELLTQRADLALSFAPVRGPDVEHAAIGTAPLVAVVSRDHRVAAQGPRAVTAEDLAQWPLAFPRLDADHGLWHRVLVDVLGRRRDDDRLVLVPAPLGSAQRRLVEVVAADSRLVTLVTEPYAGDAELVRLPLHPPRALTAFASWRAASGPRRVLDELVAHLRARVTGRGRAGAPDGSGTSGPDTARARRV
jgi:DNA-binding transcriptional LysR family regulator